MDFSFRVTLIAVSEIVLSEEKTADLSRFPDSPQWQLSACDTARSVADTQ